MVPEGRSSNLHCKRDAVRPRSNAPSIVADGGAHEGTRRKTKVSPGICRHGNRSVHGAACMSAIRIATTVTRPKISASTSLIEEHLPTRYVLRQYQTEIRIEQPADQILSFDITLAGTNENGAATCMKIFGVEILNEGSGVSIDDAVTEMQATSVARYVEPWQVVFRPVHLGACCRRDGNLLPRFSCRKLGSAAKDEVFAHFAAGRQAQRVMAVESRAGRGEVG